MDNTKKAATSKKATPLAHGVGRRKSSVARVWLKKGTGAIIINGKKSEEYFPTELTRFDVTRPFSLVPASAGYDVFARVTGGGSCSQAGAVRLGIARALVEHDEAVKPVLRQQGLLTVDSRLKERKKYGQRSARARFQFVKR